jgi:nucleoside-diphosphate-sugar epimerase
MNMERVLITGGSGFIGSHLTEKLLSLGNEVVVFDSVPISQARNLEKIKNHKNLTYVEGDIRNKKDLEKVITDDVDKIFHLAAIVGVYRYLEDPLKVIDVNIGGTRNIIQLAHKHKTKIIFTSTSEIYGKNPRVPWEEVSDRVLGNTNVERWSYSTSKAACEYMLLGMHKNHGLPITIIRYFNVYGPRQHPKWVISQNVHKALRGERPLVYDGGRQTRCFTYIDDAIEGTIMAANNPKANGEAFNIGSDNEITMRDAIELIIKVSGKKVKWKDVDTKKQFGGKYEDIPRRVPDVSKAKRVLGWATTTPLETGLEKTIGWANQNEWWVAQK